MNAKIRPGHICKTCGWPVIYTLCNGGMGRTQPYINHDWWVYCANKTCEKHPGEAHDPNNVPEFVHVQDQTPVSHRGRAYGL